jgi:hypothetical protein
MLQYTREKERQLTPGNITNGFGKELWVFSVGVVLFLVVRHLFFCVVQSSCCLPLDQQHHTQTAAREEAAAEAADFQTPFQVFQHLPPLSRTIGMASPLSEFRQAALNSRSPTKSISLRNDYEVTMQTTVDSDSDGLPSSPFVADISATAEDLENISPSKFSRLSSKSPVDRESTSSPLKILKSRASPPSRAPSSSDASEPMLSPRKISSPIKRFPVKPSSPVMSQVTERTVSIDDVLRDNEGLTKAIEILEDGDSDLNEELELDDTVASLAGRTAVNEDQGADDTMISTFSEFSALPEMTMFAKLSQGASKHASMPPTPRRAQTNTPATLRSHRYTQSRDDGHTENLMDFTEQFNGFAALSQQTPRRASPYKSPTMPDLSWASTPAVNRNMSNLLDFDIPPAPTPRSMPSITPRELESLKSNFLSEISSLKASLSGKEAELQFLKTAVGDAEKRVGESLEQVREERDLRAQLAAEKEEWEKRSREMEAVLRNVKEEIMHGEKERDELEGRLEESEGRRQVAEMMAQEAESKLAAMRAGKAPPSSPGRESKPGECVCGGARAVELAVEKVSRELHTLYKDKHETKVSALKKSYEKRWDKKVRELEGQVEELSRENEELRLGRDTTMTKVEPKNTAEEMEKQAARDAKMKEYEAELEGLAEVVKSVKQDNSDLRQLLDEERVEKGKLVAAVDEMIPLIAAYDDMLSKMESAPSPAPTIQSPSKLARPLSQSSNPEGFRSSISRASGLRAPTSKSGMNPGESRIGRGGFGAPAPAGGSQDRGRNGNVMASAGRPGSGIGYRSGIMNSIEKMGNYKTRGE